MSLVYRSRKLSSTYRIRRDINVRFTGDICTAVTLSSLVTQDVQS